MKILYISSGSPDYLADTILHGLRSLYGNNVVDVPKMEHMYSNAFPEEEMKTYGRGFTIFRTLDDLEIDRKNILKKIQDNYFDLIIWASVHRNKSFFYSAIDSGTKCIFLDGEDGQHFDSLFPNLIWRCGYYKRELEKSFHKNLKPIGFSFPEEKITTIYNKTQTNATVIPGYQDTYIFDNEKNYFEDYQKSLFAITHKKSGWDCLRHYEIIFNNCMPFFIDIEQCPQQTLSFFPKNLLIQVKNLKGVKLILQNNKPTIEIDDTKFDEGEYKLLLSQIVDNCKAKITTKKMAEYLINNI